MKNTYFFIQFKEKIIKGSNCKEEEKKCLNTLHTRISHEDFKREILREKEKEKKKRNTEIDISRGREYPLERLEENQAVHKNALKTRSSSRLQSSEDRSRSSARDGKVSG